MPRAVTTETARRVQQVHIWLCERVPDKEIQRRCAEEYGLGTRHASHMIRLAREQMFEDWKKERPQFIAEHLATLDLVIQRAMASNDFNAVVGALRLQAQAARIVGS